MRIFTFKCIALIGSLCLVMPGMPAFGNTFLAPPALNGLVFQRSMQDAEGIPEGILNEASTIDDIIAYIWQQNVKGIHPLGINLELYTEQHGQFAVYYLIKDLRKYFQGLSYFIDPSPQTLGGRVNRITGKKLFKKQQLKTDVFFHVKEIFGRLCAEGQLEKCKRLGDFLDFIEKDAVLLKVNLGYLTGAVGKRKKFADLLGVDETKIPKDWGISFIDLTVKQIKALRDLFKPKVADGSINDCKRLGNFLDVIEKDAILLKVHLAHLTGAVGKRKKFADLLGVKEDTIPKDWKILKINLSVKQIKALRDLFKPKVADGSINDCKRVDDFLDVIEKDPVLSGVHLGHLTGAVGKRKKFADLLGVDETKIPKDWNIPFINLSVRQLKAFRDLFKPEIIKYYNSPAKFKQAIKKDKILSDVSINELMRLIRNRRLFAVLIGVEAEVLSAQWKACFGIQRRRSWRAIATAP